MSENNGPFDELVQRIDDFLGNEPIGEYVKARKERKVAPKEFSETELAVAEALGFNDSTRADLALYLGYSKKSIENYLNPREDNPHFRPDLHAAFYRGRMRKKARYRAAAGRKALQGDTAMLIHMLKYMFGDEHRPLYVEDIGDDEDVAKDSAQRFASALAKGVGAFFGAKQSNSTGLK